jgi:beta-lactam-binding protein with PASTA domain
MKWIRVFLYLLACGVVFVLSTSLTIRFLLRDDTSVTCPNLAGLDLEDAKRAADKQGLSVLVVKYEKRRDIPYDHVLVQKPDADTPVRVGRAVSVVLSDGPRPQAIPNVVGLDTEEAKKAGQQMNIPIKKILYVPSETTGKVLAQIPSGGQNILNEEGITLVVGGREKKLFLMPDTAGKDLIALVPEMEKKGIKYVYVSSQTDSVKGASLKTKVLPGTIFGGDTAIELPTPTNGGGQGPAY